MIDLILFCKPSNDLSNLYKTMNETEVAKNYTQMAINEFDKFVNFAPDYNPIIPDLSGLIGKKAGKDLYFTLFVKQPIVKIGSKKFNLTSSSYLFNPGFSEEDLYLPDLDIIEVNNMKEKLVQLAIDQIKLFYEKHSWRTYIYPDKLEKTKELKSIRFPYGIDIFDPILLIEIAKEKLEYNSDKLYF